MIRNVVVISDTHFGCRLALCPPSGCCLDDGGEYMPSDLQRRLWAIWLEFWAWVDVELDGEPFVLVHNGDSIDGVHHNSTTQISHNLEDQGTLAVETLAPYVAKAHTYYHIRGTEAHVGKSGVEEERVAKRLGAKPNAQGQHARYDLWLDLGGHMIHFLHHVGTVSSNAYEASAVGKELSETINEAGRWGHEIPSCVVRAHRHRHYEVKGPTHKGECIAFVTAAWQLKTPFAYKVAGARVSTPQIGGSIIRLHKSGVLYTRHFVKPVERSACESVNHDRRIDGGNATAGTPATGRADKLGDRADARVATGKGGKGSTPSAHPRRQDRRRK